MIIRIDQFIALDEMLELTKVGYYIIINKYGACININSFNGLDYRFLICAEGLSDRNIHGDTTVRGRIIFLRKQHPDGHIGIFTE